MQLKRLQRWVDVSSMADAGRDKYELVSMASVGPPSYEALRDMRSSGRPGPDSRGYVAMQQRLVAQGYDPSPPPPQAMPGGVYGAQCYPQPTRTKAARRNIVLKRLVEVLGVLAALVVLAPLILLVTILLAYYLFILVAILIGAG